MPPTAHHPSLDANSAAGVKTNDSQHRRIEIDLGAVPYDVDRLNLTRKALFETTSPSRDLADHAMYLWAIRRSWRISDGDCIGSYSHSSFG